MASSDTQERVRRLEKLILDFKFRFRQIYGQRIYGPPLNYDGERPRKGCEVFVTNIPPDVFEDDLIRNFSQAGNLYEVKLMMEFSGMNRGFAYFLYTKPAYAHRAISLYHGANVNQSFRLACYLSLDNSRLYIEGIPRGITCCEVEDAFVNLFPDADVTVFKDESGVTENLGIGFIEFGTHRKAAEVRKLLWPSRLGMWGREIFVEWAVPIPHFSENTIPILIVQNVGYTTSAIAFTNFVMSITEGRGCVCNITKRGDYATIQYLTQQHAHKSMKIIEGTMFDGNKLKVYYFELNCNTKAHYLLYLQWSQSQQRKFEDNSLGNQCLTPYSCAYDLAKDMRGYLREANEWIQKNHPSILCCNNE